MMKFSVSKLVLGLVFFGAGLLINASSKDVSTEIELPNPPVFDDSTVTPMWPQYSSSSNSSFSSLDNYGIGIIGAPHRYQQHYAILDYWGDFSFPLFSSNNNHSFLAWVKDGWYVQGDNISAFSGESLPEAGYEIDSFLVEKFDISTGWLRIKFKLHKNPDWIRAWTNLSYLKQNTPSLTYISWEEFFGESGGQVYFRVKQSSNQFLRAEPNDKSAVLANIPDKIDDSRMETLEIQGDWMKVKYHSPDCGGCAGVECNVEHEKLGWIKWKTKTHGPIIWFYSRGC